MSSEWMKVMLEEIARKKAESEQARAEERQRAEEGRSAEDQRRARAQPRAEEQRRAEERQRGGGQGSLPRSGADRLHG
ncbi:MAG: hypothetical protein WBF21_15520 [Steroidobacteraceae bacterium]|jgi:hypothetical protein